MKTLVVNLYGGPGAGKSTFCASVFAKLKWEGVECEMALEYAKDRVWEGSNNVLENQLYVFGKQQHRMFRINGKVEVIVTDSPLLNSIIYDAKNDAEFRKLIVKEYHKYDNVDFFIERAKEYNPVGRLQTEEEAKAIDQEIQNMLKEYEIPYNKVVGYPENADFIVEIILGILDERREKKEDK